jgi:hypothetical protein
MTSRSNLRADAARQLTEPPAAAGSPARRMVRELVSGLRRVTGLHGDAVGNAKQAVRDDERARSHRVRVADETRAINEAYPVEPAAFDVEQATSSPGAGLPGRRLRR